MKAATVTEKKRKVYDLRPRALPSLAGRPRVGRVSKVEKVERAKGKAAEDDEVSRVEVEEAAKSKKTKDAERKKRLKRLRTAYCRGPPPLTARAFGRIHVEYATTALDEYNRNRREKGLSEYTRVDTMGCEMLGTNLGCGLVYHLNFKARPKDDPGAPPELFFAERLFCWRGSEATHCYSLGTQSPDPTDSVGFEACLNACPVYHPTDTEFIASRSCPTPPYVRKLLPK